MGDKDNAEWERLGNEQEDERELEGRELGDGARGQGYAHFRPDFFPPEGQGTV